MDPSNKKVLVARSEEMQFVAYVLARCGDIPPDGGPSAPPSWLGTANWKATYSLFYDRLGDGRTLPSFANSLKNARDAFDAHVPSGRVGWIDLTGKPYRQDAMVGRVLSKWKGKSDDELREVVQEILTGLVVHGDEEEETSARTEGGVKLYLVKKYERIVSLRKDAIKIHGMACMACAFDFAATYGELGKDYIEVHHAMPLAEYGTRETDPATDLLVLCSNCHRMIHRRRGVCLSLDELKQKLMEASAVSQGNAARLSELLPLRPAQVPQATQSASG